MNKKLLLLSVAMFLALFSVDAQDLKTPRPSPMAKVTQEFALGEITLDYSRPSVKGRTIYGNLVPYGKIWRTGANYSTKITVTDIIQIEGNKVEPGTYAIYTIPGKDKWEVMLYSDLKLGGNVAKYDKANEVVRFSVTPTTVTEKVESFTINIADLRDESATLEMIWENTRVPIKITAAIDEVIMANIKKTVIEDNRPYYTAARYYYENDKDLVKALEWIKIASAKRPDAYWVKMQQARIEHKLGKKKDAIATAKEVKKIAGEKNNDDYVKMADELISDASK